MPTEDQRNTQLQRGNRTVPNALPALPKPELPSGRPGSRAQASVLAGLTVALTVALGAAVLATNHGQAPKMRPANKASPAPAAASPNEPSHEIPMLPLLPEPDGIALARAVPIAPQGAAPAQVKSPTPLPAPAVLPEPEPVAETSACDRGSHPIGDCDCVSDNYSKSSLRLNPTPACLDREAKRLGHQVILRHGENQYELAGTAPEPALITEKPPAASVASISPGARASSAEAATSSVSSAETANAAAAVASAGAGSSTLATGPSPTRCLQIEHEAKAEYEKAILSISATPLWGQCPPGTKTEPCACEVFPEQVKSGPSSYKWIPVRFVPAAGAPPACSDPGMQSAIRTSKSWLEIYQAADKFLLKAQKDAAKKEMDDILTATIAACARNTVAKYP